MKDNYDRKQAIELINKYKSVFGNDYYLEIQSSDNKEQVKANKEIIELSKLTDTKIVVTTEVHFLNKEDFEAHNVFININQDRDTENYKYCYLQSREEILTILSYLDEQLVNQALDNTFEVADKCNYLLEKTQFSNIANWHTNYWLETVEFDNNEKSVCRCCNEWLKEHNVMVLDYDVISYGYQNSNYKIILAYYI